MSTPRLLVTRFEPHATRLANILKEHGIFAHAQPLLTMAESTADIDTVVANNHDLIIAVSGNAVDYTDLALAGKPWPIATYLAVGNGTKTKLEQACKQNVIVPVQGFDSEGLLALPCLQNVTYQKVLILRGVGGRELLAERLMERGAFVNYFESYQRIALQLDALSLVKQWQQENLNGAIISSVELLQRLYDIVPEAARPWLKTLTIYAPSERILKYAMSMGWSSRKLLPSLVDEDILAYFTQDN
ncbi:uroporphyrinogen-III synthase [Psychromonas sp. MME1]|uniref:uroporphyrinogen-III synthase n=1 Tax=Psychromonas sp. MME1 TaxID=3231032 RepID=UPI0034E1D139